ncbi:trihelix transcription factor ENAP2-like [Magnolia sinica]|uniref:trihelix transcription factor ENAP2-like n=1 Tax=Magnolia sinica TaxID=86752 RepID=UPI0026589328|nr:trihelix transcription factor ENAP2-like [Magnolia sinica]
MDSAEVPIGGPRGAERLQLGPLIEAGAAEGMAMKTPDRSKRDEWSEGGVLSLLEVYESKWLIRNRAKLKGSDWEDIARRVSDRSSGTKALKTPNQCKNKIESMKKRYRAESPGSSWQFYARMDSLLKGTCNSQAKGDAGCVNGAGESGPQALPKVETGDSEHVLRQAPDESRPQEIGKNTQILDVANVEVVGHAQDSDRDGGSNTLGNDRKESKGMDSDVSTPRSKVPNAADGLGKADPIKRRKRSAGDVAESIRMLANSVLKIEQTRMEMYKDMERMRAEAEIRRAEMELKRTEIIANTQLQIAKLLSNRSPNQSNRSGASSLRTEPSMSLTVPMNADRRKG